MEQTKSPTGVDVKVLSPGSVATLDATSVTTYPSSSQPSHSLPGGSGGMSGWAPAWPFMMPQTPVIVVTVDKKDGDKKSDKRTSEVFTRL